MPRGQSPEVRAFLLALGVSLCPLTLPAGVCASGLSSKPCPPKAIHPEVCLLLVDLRLLHLSLPAASLVFQSLCISACTMGVLIPTLKFHGRVTWMASHRHMINARSEFRWIFLLGSDAYSQAGLSNHMTQYRWNYTK